MGEPDPKAPFRRLQRAECGYLGLSIDADGQWSYLDSPIRRIELVKLFATVLSRDADGQHWMTTPIEHGTVRVADVAFVGLELAISGTGRDRKVRLRTNLDDWVEIGPDHPLRVVEQDANGHPGLYVLIRKGLEARLNRATAYELMLLALEAADPPPSTQAPDQGGDGAIGLWCGGWYCVLGHAGMLGED